SSRQSRRRFMTPSLSNARWPAAPASAAPPRRGSENLPPPRVEGFSDDLPIFAAPRKEGSSSPVEQRESGDRAAFADADRAPARGMRQEGGPAAAAGRTEYLSEAVPA